MTKTLSFYVQSISNPANSMFNDSYIISRAYSRLKSRTTIIVKSHADVSKTFLYEVDNCNKHYMDI